MSTNKTILCCYFSRVCTHVLFAITEWRECATKMVVKKALSEEKEWRETSRTQRYKKRSHGLLRIMDYRSRLACWLGLFVHFCTPVFFLNSLGFGKYRYEKRESNRGKETRGKERIKTRGKADFFDLVYLHIFIHKKPHSSIIIRFVYTRGTAFTCEKVWIIVQEKKVSEE